MEREKRRLSAALGWPLPAYRMPITEGHLHGGLRAGRVFQKGVRSRDTFCLLKEKSDSLSLSWLFSTEKVRDKVWLMTAKGLRSMKQSFSVVRPFKVEISLTG